MRPFATSFHVLRAAGVAMPLAGTSVSDLEVISLFRFYVIGVWPGLRGEDSFKIPNLNCRHPQTGLWYIYKYTRVDPHISMCGVTWTSSEVDQILKLVSSPWISLNDHSLWMITLNDCKLIGSLSWSEQMMSEVDLIVKLINANDQWGFAGREERDREREREINRSTARGSKARSVKWMGETQMISEVNMGNSEKARKDPGIRSPETSYENVIIDIRYINHMKQHDKGVAHVNSLTYMYVYATITKPN